MLLHSREKSFFGLMNETSETPHRNYILISKRLPVTSPIREGYSRYGSSQHGSGLLQGRRPFFVPGRLMDMNVALRIGNRNPGGVKSPLDLAYEIRFHLPPI